MKSFVRKENMSLAAILMAGILSAGIFCSVAAEECDLKTNVKELGKQEVSKESTGGSLKDLVGTVENPEDSVIGKWCVTGGHADETIEFLEDETMILASGGVETKGYYMQDPTNECVYYMLESASDTQNASGILYYKINGDHLALLSTEGEMELDIYTAYYTREEAVENYNLEDDIEGLQRRAWTVQSGVETIEIAGEEYDADKMYYVFGMNLLQIGEPQNMGDGYYTKMLYAPYEYSEDCSKITFFFNEPFSEEIGVTYEMELSDDELKFVGEDGEKIIFELVEVTE